MDRHQSGLRPTSSSEWLYTLNLIFMTFVSFCAIYAPTRLYFIGEYRIATISRVEVRHETNYTNNGLPISFDYSRIILQNYPNTFRLIGVTGLKEGNQVPLLYSDRLQEGVIVANRHDYFDMLFSYGGGPSLVGMLLLVVLAAWRIPLRLYQTANHIQRVVTSSWIDTVKNDPHKVLAAAKLVSLVTAICVGLALAVALVAITVKATWSVEQSGPIVTALILTPLFLAVLWLPIPEWLIDLVRYARGSQLTLIEILRNIVFTVAGLLLIRKLVQFTQEVDLKSYDSLLDVFWELLSTLIG